MSLEQALQENTAAVRELLAELKKGGKTASKSTEKETKQSQAESKANDAQVDKAPKVDKEELQAKIKEYASGGNKARAQALMGEYGYDKMAEIQPKDYDAIYDACVKGLAAADDDDI